MPRWRCPTSARADIRPARRTFHVARDSASQADDVLRAPQHDVPRLLCRRREDGRPAPRHVGGNVRGYVWHAGDAFSTSPRQR